MDAKEIRFGILSAFGGALLTIGGQITVEAFKASNAESVKAADAANSKSTDAAGELQKFSDAFTALGDTPRRAAEFAEGGNDGSVDDVRVVVRNLSHVVRMVAAERVSREMLQKTYGGVLGGWGRRLSAIADGSSSVSKRFSRIERYNFTFLGAALSEMSGGAMETGDPFADFGTISNDVMMTSNGEFPSSSNTM